MTFENNLPYEIVKTIECGIRDEVTDHIGWYMEEKLYIITNGEKYGMVYDQKSRCWPIESPKYDVLFDCKWDHLDVIDTEYGAYVVAYLGGKCSFFYLLGDKEIIEENDENHKNLFFISVKQISDHPYESINYHFERCNQVLFLNYENHMQYYDLKQERFSDIYDSVGYLDEEFIYCTKNDITICLNIKDNVCFPNIPDCQWPIFHCRYKDGRVYYILTNRDCEENEYEAYLIFYSKKDKTFYATEIYDEIILHTYSKNGKASYLSVIEGIKDGVCDFYANNDEFEWDIDISSIDNLRIMDVDDKNIN